MQEKTKGLGKAKAFLRKHTFIAVFVIALLIAGTNYLVYPVLITRNLGLTYVPVARDTIAEGTLITEDMIKSISISSDTLPDGIILKSEAVEGMYVKQNSSVPKNGFFYEEQIADEKDAMGNIYKELYEGELSYTVPLSSRYNQNGLIKPGQHLDFYMYTWTDSEGAGGETLQVPVYGMFAENIRVISIDPLSEDYFLTLAVTEEDLKYFQLAEMITSKNSGSIYPLLDSDSYLGSEESIFMDIDDFRGWISERALVFEYSDEIKTIKKLKKAGLYEEPAGAEIIGDGASAD